MSRLTDARRAIRAALPDDLEIEVITGPQDRTPSTFQGDSRPLQMIVRVKVGEPTEENKERLDCLLDEDDEQSIAGTLIVTAPVPLKVLGSSGWRSYQQAKDSPPALGAEWTLEVTP